MKYKYIVEEGTPYVVQMPEMEKPSWVNYGNPDLLEVDKEAYNRHIAFLQKYMLSVEVPDWKGREDLIENVDFLLHQDERQIQYDNGEWSRSLEIIEVAIPIVKSMSEQSNSNEQLEIQEKFAAIDNPLFQEWRRFRTKAISEMFDKPDSVGIYPTTEFFNKVDRYVLALIEPLHNNKEEGKEDEHEDELWNEVALIGIPSMTALAKLRSMFSITRKSQQGKDNEAVKWTDKDMEALIDWCGGEEGYNLINEGETTKSLLNKFKQYKL